MRAVVYILVLALVIGLIATMVSSALASPLPTASPTPATAAEDATQSTTANTTASAAPSPAAVDPASAQTSEPGGKHGELGPVVVLGTVDLTWADLLAASDSDDPSLSSAAKALLAYAGAGRPVNLVTRTVGERTCPADGWLTLGAGARVRAAAHSGYGSAGCRWPADWAEAADTGGSGTAGAAGPANATTARAGMLAGILAREGTTTTAVGSGGVLALTNGNTVPEVGDSPSELLAREDPPDLIIADTVPQSADPGDAGDAAFPASPTSTSSTAGSAPDASDADRILALAAALEPLADAPASTRVVVASVADATDPSPQLAILPPGTSSPLKTSTGLLVGPSTHRRGLIQLTDLAPALFLGVTGQKPGPYWSQPLEIAPELREHPTDGALGTGSVSGGLSQARLLADDALHARASQRANVPAGLVLIGAALALGLAAARVLRAPRAATGGEPQPATSEEPQTTTDGEPQAAARGRAGGEQPRPTTAPDPSEAPGDSPAADSMGPAVSTPSGTGTTSTAPPRKHLRALAWAACLITALPAGLWLANMLPWWRTGNATAAALGLALAFAVASVTVTGAAARGALALMRRLRPQAPRLLLTELGIAGAGNGRGSDSTSTTPQDLAALISSLLLAALTAVVIFYDAGYRAPIAFNGPLGMNAVVAGRFYGMSNTAFALAAASLLVTIAAWSGPLVAAQQGSRESRHAAAVALVAVPGVMALILDAAPEMGADIGGALTLVPALVALGAGLAGVRLGWRRWVAVGAAAVGIVLLLGLIDFLFGGSSTHLGGFFNQLLTGTAGATLTRKATALIAPFISNWLAVAALAVGVSVIALIGRWAMRAVHEARQGNGPYAWLTGPGVLPQWLRPLGRALAVLVIVEVLVNDSGLAMLWFSAAAAVPALTAILAARLAAAGSAGPAEAATAPARPSAPTAAGE